METVEASRDVRCLAVSKDGRWIAAGTSWGDVFVWNAKTYRKVISHRDYNRIRRDVNGVDFSPDSTRLVSASDNGTASIWDIATRLPIQILDHEKQWVTTAKYSSQGDRIATASPNSVRVWDSNDGRLLKNVRRVGATPWYNTGLLWSNNHLFVMSDNEVKQIDASSGSAVSRRPVPGTSHFSCIALPKHEEFIAYSTQRTITLSDTAIHSRIGLIQHPQDIRSIAVSPNDQFLAIGGQDGKITIHSLSRNIVSILSRWIVVHMKNFLALITPQ